MISYKTGFAISLKKKSKTSIIEIEMQGKLEEAEENLFSKRFRKQ